MLKIHQMCDESQEYVKKRQECTEEMKEYHKHIGNINNLKSRIEEYQKRIADYQKKYETPGFDQLCVMCSTEVNERTRKRSKIE